MIQHWFINSLIFSRYGSLYVAKSTSFSIDLYKINLTQLFTPIQYTFKIESHFHLQMSDSLLIAHDVKNMRCSIFDIRVGLIASCKYVYPNDWSIKLSFIHLSMQNTVYQIDIDFDILIENCNVESIRFLIARNDISLLPRVCSKILNEGCIHLVNDMFERISNEMGQSSLLVMNKERATSLYSDLFDHLFGHLFIGSKRYLFECILLYILSLGEKKLQEQHTPLLLDLCVELNEFETLEQLINFGFVQTSNWMAKRIYSFHKQYPLFKHCAIQMLDQLGHYESVVNLYIVDRQVSTLHSYNNLILNFTLILFHYNYDDNLIYIDLILRSVYARHRLCSRA